MFVVAPWSIVIHEAISSLPRPSRILGWSCGSLRTAQAPKYLLTVIMTGWYSGPTIPCLLDVFPSHDGVIPATGEDNLDGDLEQYVRHMTRAKHLDECENAIAELPSGVVKHLSEIFNQVAASLLPAPTWQHPSTPAKKGRQRESSLVLRSLRIVSAARLALAAEDKIKDQRLHDKIDRIYRAASTYLDSTYQQNDLDELEALLLLSELEYGRGHAASAESRLQVIISDLSNADRIRSMLLLGQSAALVRRRNVLRSALLMLHWYFGQIAPVIQNLDGEAVSVQTGQLIDADELFTISQLRLISLHQQLQNHLLQQPYTDEKMWHACDRSLVAWYDTLRDQYKALDTMSDDAPVNFFVFQQQYLTSRILLSKLHSRRFHRLSASSRVASPVMARTHGSQSSPASARNDAVKIASSLRNYGQRHRFREAPLCFLNHISAAADVVLGAILGVSSEDDKNAYLHIASFLCGVLRYMAEVHPCAAIMLEASQQRLNTVMLRPPAVYSNAFPESVRPQMRPLSPESPGRVADGHNSHLWHWTRHDFTAEFGHAAPPVEAERSRSVLGVLKTAEELKLRDSRPVVRRQISTPGRVTMEDDTATVTPEREIYSRVTSTGDGQGASGSQSGRGLDSMIVHGTND